MSTFMSSERRRSPASAARAIGQPPTAIESRYSGSATVRGAPARSTPTAIASTAAATNVETVRASWRQNGTRGAPRRRSTGRAR